eukprot:7067783-Ditylum_brightwellii.AAC.1
MDRSNQPMRSEALNTEQPVSVTPECAEEESSDLAPHPEDANAIKSKQTNTSTSTNESETQEDLELTKMIITTYHMYKDTDVLD